VPLTITQALRLAAAAELLLVAGSLLRDHRRSRVAASALMLIACVVGYLATPMLSHSAVPALVRVVAAAGALAVPFAFWVATRLFFDDAFQPRPVHGALVLGLLVVRALVLPWPLAASGIALAAVVDALRRIHGGTETDLLLTRLRLRYVVLLGTGLYAVIVIIAEATVPRGSALDGMLSSVNDVGLFVLITAIAATVLRVDPDLIRTGAKRASAAPEPATMLERRLERLIEEEQVFKTEGLTIGGLAERLGEHEYKVRQLINAHLGFRNFGAFLNHYRIREARKVLADRSQKQLGIAEIAYRFGYSSLGPFNRAFKEIVGQTPTEYRKAEPERQILADSEIGGPSSKRS
jgi:AraC-like DNA-binding protein